jgi:sRNA-binding regulator protein Hfq
MGTDEIPWGPVEDEYELMSINEIINGQKVSLIYIHAISTID